MRPSKKSVALFAIVLLALCSMAGNPFGGFLPSSVHADSGTSHKGSKLSQDLRQKVFSGQNLVGQSQVVKGGPIPVIVQTLGFPSNALLSAIGVSKGSVKRIYRNIAALHAQLPPAAVASLVTRPDINYMSFDRPAHISGHLETTTGADQVRTMIGTTGIPGPPGPPGATGVLDGSGIGIAILDSGVSPGQHAFLATNSSAETTQVSRIVANVDFTGEGTTDDLYGHGTHVASIAAGNAHIAQGGYTGIAPGANILNLRVINAQGTGATSALLAAIDWCITNQAAYNIRVMNMSLGSPALDSYQNDPICLAVRRAFNAGIVCCAAAGNSGKDALGNKLMGMIHSPGIEPCAITVGAANTLGTDNRNDDRIASYSSRGPTRGYYVDTVGVKHYDNLIKPDIVAPGNKIIDAASPAGYLITAHPELDADMAPPTGHSIMYMSGTSMATPAVAGAVALILQRNPALNPNLVKAVLEYTAEPLSGYSTLEQGAGELNVEGAVRLAAAIRPDLMGRSLGDPLLIGPSPAESSTIGGVTFQWAGGLVQKWNLIWGTNLIQEYNGIYGGTSLLTDGTLLSSGVFLSDGTLLAAGVTASQGVLTSDGTILSNGTVFLQGTVLADGTVLSDGVLLGDGVLLSDGALLSDSTLVGDSTKAESILSNGDPGPAMSPKPGHSP